MARLASQWETNGEKSCGTYGFVSWEDNSLVTERKCLHSGTAYEQSPASTFLTCYFQLVLDKEETLDFNSRIEVLQDTRVITNQNSSVSKWTPTFTYICRFSEQLLSSYRMWGQQSEGGCIANLICLNTPASMPFKSYVSFVVRVIVMTLLNMSIKNLILLHGGLNSNSNDCDHVYVPVPFRSIALKIGPDAIDPNITRNIFSN